MRKLTLARIFVAWIASNLLWAVAAPGMGLVVSAVLTGFVHIGQPWRSFFFVGVLLLGTGLLLGLVRPLVLARLPRPPSPAIPSSTAAEIARAEAIERLDKEEAERRRRDRRTAQEALTTLEFQRAKLAQMARDFDRMHQGMWPVNRDSFFEEAANARAGRLAERAFITLGNIPNPGDAGYTERKAEAIRAIEVAIPALEASAGITHSVKQT